MARPSYQQNKTRSAYTISFNNFYNAVNGCCTSLSKRKRKWLGNPIMAKMDYISEAVLYLSGGTITGSEAAQIVTDTIDDIYENLKKLKKPFYSLWNYRNFSNDKMQAWIDMMMQFARDLNLRYPDYRNREPITEELFSVPKFNKYDKADFVDKMYQIHKQSITYVTNTSGRYTDATQYSIVKLANEALCEVVDGNKIWAEGLENHNKRCSKFIRASNIVKTLGAEVVRHGKFHGFSDASMNRWVKSIDEEVKLLNGIIRSEKKQIKAIKDSDKKDVK